MARNGPPTDEERARWAKFDERLSCMPCLQGEHEHCRHHPEGPRFSGPDSEKGKPCACEQEQHQRVVGYCTDYRYGDYAGRYCMRPAKGTVEIPATFGSYTAKRSEPVAVERCGIHLAGLKRSAENMARWRAEWAERDARYDEERRNAKASSDWVERLAELGIPAKATGGQVLSVMVDPERLYGMIHEAVVEMDFAGIEHRFQPLPEPEE